MKRYRRVMIPLPPWQVVKALAYQLRNAPCLVDVRESFTATGVIIGQALMVQAEQVQDRGMVICHLGATLDRPVTEVIGGPVGLASPDPATCHPDTKTVWMMIPALVATLGLVTSKFGTWSPAKLTAPLDECGIQQASLLQILQ